MSAVVAQLEKILSKTKHLIERCNMLQQENQQLKLENQQIKTALQSSVAQVAELNENLRVLKLAKSIDRTHEKTLDIKQKINEFVREIDKCVFLLKK